MLSDEKILITGPAGQIAFPLAEYLAADNEVWGIARFGEPESRDRVEAAGITTRVCDLGGDDLSTLPEDFTYVLHLATFQGGGLDYDHALTVNAEGTGLLLAHCRRAKAALVMSTASLLKPHPDPWHVYLETDPLGDANAVHAPTYSVSKIGEEAVARACARMLNLPVVIARMNASFGPNGGLPTYHLDFMVAGAPVIVRSDPAVYSPIHQDDINTQTEALLGAASVPACIVNWAGDEPVSAQQWCADLAEITGLQPEVVVKSVPGSLSGQAMSPVKRESITGPCQVPWKEGLRRTVAGRYPDGIVAGQPVPGPASLLLSAYQAVPDT